MGVDSWEVTQSAEVFLPATSTSCQLAAYLVQGRDGHTQDGLLACGGDHLDTSCEQFSPATGTWARTSHTLQQRRYGHVSWSVEEGTILMGGGHQYGARLTTEIVKHGGTTETSFHMKYGTMYETIQCNFYCIFLRSRPVDLLVRLSVAMLKIVTE